ncbi:MAG: glycosyltransferase [Patescibacteria group bacterium]
MEKFFHKLFYGFLISALIISLGLFLSHQLTTTTGYWNTFGRVYFYFLIAYTWYIFLLLFIDDFKVRRYPAYDGSLISVIMPVFNEAPELLHHALQSLIAAQGNKEIIVVDDGSTNSSHYILRQFADKGLVLVHHFLVNKGKRHAIHYAVKHLIKGKMVVCVDSDTVVDRDALVRIVEPLSAPSIGASTGDVRLLNEHTNWLTRMVGAYYWVGLNIYKRAQSTLGIVVCCSGCLSAYRNNTLQKIIDEFVTQAFFNEPCTHSEDRHLTNLVLKQGYRVVYQDRAVSYTHTPDTLKGFLKQQQRWKRGYVRESIYTLSWAWRTRKILFFEIILWDLTLTFLSLGIRLASLIVFITQPLFFIRFILPGWLYFMSVRYVFVLFYAPQKILGLIYYTFLYEFVLYWQNIIALFTLKNKSWMTR